MSVPAPRTSRRSTGQYFTPRAAADLAFDILDVLAPGMVAKAEDILDPSCGEGVFLQAALERRGGSGQGL
ncbi:MAG: N-6 DNA methylase, partial [bacterium]